MGIDKTASDIVVGATVATQCIITVDLVGLGYACSQNGRVLLFGPTYVEREFRTKIEHVGISNVPLHPELGAETVPAVAGVRSAAQIAHRIWKQILSVETTARIAVGMGVEHIAAHTQFLLIADIKVDAELLRGVNSVISAEIAETPAPLVGKAHLVYIVAASDNRDLIAVLEPVHVETSLITVIGAVTCRYVSEPAVVHVFLDGQVDHGLVFAVIDSGETRGLALAVDHLNLLDHVRGEILRRHLRIVGKKLLAVDQDLGDSLASRRDRTV